MRTDREQIEKMAQAMCGFCAVDKRCVLKCCAPCSEVASQDCTCKESAEELIHKGYGNVSEYKNRFEVADKVLTETKSKLTKAEHDRDRYKAEIERLKDEIIYLERKIAIRDNALKDRDKAIEMLEGKQDTIVKQAKIDVLNRVMTYINDKIENDYGDMSDSVNYLTIDIDDFDDFIDELIKEVENDTK